MKMEVAIIRSFACFIAVFNIEWNRKGFNYFTIETLIFYRNEMNAQWKESFNVCYANFSDRKCPVIKCKCFFYFQCPYTNNTYIFLGRSSACCHNKVATPCCFIRNFSRPSASFFYEIIISEWFSLRNSLRFKLCKHNSENYGPISLTSSISEIFEKPVTTRLAKFLDADEILSVRVSIRKIFWRYYNQPTNHHTQRARPK